MSMKLVCKKGTILIPSGPYHDPGRKHLFVICSDVDGEGKQVIVPVCTWTNDLCDGTCKLQSHEHPFLDRLSYIRYRESDIVPYENLILGLESRNFILKEEMNSQTFLKISKGFCISLQTPRKIKKYLNCVVKMPANSPTLRVV